MMMMMIKVRQRKDVGAPVRLPAMYSNVGQRSARSGNDLAVDTLRSFENQLGLGSRDYAARCLALAQRFNERRPWLQQVRQAVAIATTGVRRVYSQQPHFFAADNSVA